MPLSLSIPDAGALSPRRVTELGAVLATAGVHLALATHPGPHLVFVIAAVLGWSSYLVWAAARRPEMLGRWGLRREGLGSTLAIVTPLGALSALGLLAWGQLQGVGFDPWMLLPLALYPIWGVIQQLLVQGMLVRNLEDFGIPEWLVIAIAAAAFAIVHWPYPVLMVATLLLGLVVTPVYLRFGNLWALGLLHGWLGTLLYQFVLQRHPIHEALGIG
ncbi:MAG: CPBP family intramembrane metalloprotease [Deltaproteobacteria bacterium]|nr:MAG: CPBP family intramembrane metalloprotease [Deltaproteobacteria bacterium]